MKSANLLWRVVRAEGVRSLAERLLERFEEHRWRRAFQWVSLVSLLPRLPLAPAVQIYPNLWRSRRGGVPQALFARFEALAKLGPAAVLAKEPSGWTLFLAFPNGKRLAANLHNGQKNRRRAGVSDEALRLFLASLPRSLPLHLEHPGKLSFFWLLELTQSHPLVLEIHDYGYFCPRVDLLEAPELTPCGGSRDEERCRTCRMAAGETDPKPLSERRTLAEKLLASVCAVVYPSEAAQQTFQELFPRLDLLNTRVIPPALSFVPGSARTPSWPPQRVAFVGEAVPRKGFPEFIKLVKSLQPRLRYLTFLCIGGGNPQLLLDARRAGIHVAGYYRNRMLPKRLVQHRVDLAVLPSRFAETYCLALDGCHCARIPTVSSPVGALAERATWKLPVSHAEWMVSLESLLRLPEVPPCPPAPATVESSACAHAELWFEISRSAMR